MDLRKKYKLEYYNRCFKRISLNASLGFTSKDCAMEFPRQIFDNFWNISLKIPVSKEIHKCIFNML